VRGHVLAIVVSCALSACTGEDYRVGEYVGAISPGDEFPGTVFKYFVGDVGRCMASSDGLATEKRVVMSSDCPVSGYPYLARKTWTLIAVTAYRGNDFWYKIRNDSSNYCLKWISGDYYKEASCGTGYEYQFRFSPWDDSSPRIIPRSQSGYFVKPELTNFTLVETVDQYASNLYWSWYSM